MEKARQLSFEDLGSRFKTLIPVWILGTGANFGRLNPYARHLSFTLIAVIFYQELLDDVRRTRDDLVQTVFKMAESMKKDCDWFEAEKIVDALMVNEGSSKHTFAFQEQFFNEHKMEWETFRFQYLEIDRDATNFEEGLPVYKLSEEAQALFLNTNEIQKHLPVSIQQILVELLIEKGELKSALRMLDSLNHRVMTLLKEEKIHMDELIRNPKSTIYENKSRWGKQLKDVEAQFDEESQKYRKLDGILRRIAVSPEHQNTYMQLTKRLSKTKNNHDRLAKLVIENVRLELQIRNSHFRNIWLTNTTSFRKTIWEDKAKVVGFAHPDEMLTLVESLFSPYKPSILPLEWGIEEHLDLSRPTFGGTGTKTKPQLEPISLDWDSILTLWKPIFEELLKTGRVSLRHLQQIDELTMARWVENREAFDFWLAFASMDEPFIVNEENLQQIDSDDKALLLSKLMEEYPELSILRNKQIFSIPSKDSMVLRNKIDVSTYLLIMEEAEENEHRAD
ncbi:hypothetical protein [Neobacillus massiliamazoniensis]|uniref:Replicative DNA helicase n=1 Tax=Neobacillus massiliamazoniensis TaxID=1499688 RepID=A0A0U1P5C6_9BACI|nr:hypothetical protein [Neobacillus massiliamazoniensis]CRK85232.1 hypothetical protein BN000_05304 [Neobacillus massiliamazoniensis]